MRSWLHVPTLLVALACDGTPDGAPPPSAVPGPPPTANVLPSDAADLVERAEWLAALHSPAATDEAARLLGQAETLAPDSAAVLLALGRLERAGGSGEDEAQGLTAAAAGGRRGQQAARLLERAIERDPENIEAMLELARHCFTLDQIPRAIELADRALALQPDHAEALLRRGEALVRLERPAEAELALQASIDAARADGDALTVFQAQGALGEAWLLLGRAEEAETYLRDAASSLDAHRAEHPGSTTVNCPHESLARLYTRQGDRALAAEHARRAADLRAWMPRLQYLAALSLLDAGDPVGARGYLQRGLRRDGSSRLDPMRENLQRRLGGEGPGPVLGAREALPSASRLLALDQPGLAAAELAGSTGLEACQGCRIVLGFVAVSEGDHGAARAAFEAALGSEAHEAGARVGLAWLALEQGQADEALVSFEATLATDGSVSGPDPDGLDALVHRMAALGVAGCHQASGRFVLASDAYAAVLRDHPDDLQALLGRGNALNGLGQPELAAEHFRRVLLMAPDHPRALAGLGTALLNQGRLALAGDVFRVAQAVAPEGYACPFEGLGLVLLAQGEPEQARQQLERAVTTDPDHDYRKYDELARLHLEAGELEQAEALLRRSLANHPQGAEARAMLDRITGPEAPEAVR